MRPPARSAGIQAVIEGRAAVAGVVRPLKPSEKARDLYYEIIGYDAVAVFVHRSNPIQGLTRQQLKDVFTGKITDWKELGGPDAPIERVMQDRSRGTVGFFQSAVLESAPFAAVTRVEHPGDCVQYVASHPHAVTYSSMAFSFEGVKVLAVDGILPGPETIVSAEYPITRPMPLVSRGIPQGQMKLFYDFMHSAEGRAVLARHFFPLTGMP